MGFSNAIWKKRRRYFDMCRCRCRYDCEFWMLSEYLNGVIKLPFCFHLQRFNKQTKMFHFVENSSAFFWIRVVTSQLITHYVLQCETIDAIQTQFILNIVYVEQKTKTFWMVNWTLSRSNIYFTHEILINHYSIKANHMKEMNL